MFVINLDIKVHVLAMVADNKDYKVCCPFGSVLKCACPRA